MPGGVALKDGSIPFCPPRWPGAGSLTGPYYAYLKPHLGEMNILRGRQPKAPLGTLVSQQP